MFIQFLRLMQAVTDATIMGINIIDGDSVISGGCIINDGVMTITDCTISGCDTGVNGGGYT